METMGHVQRANIGETKAARRIAGEAIATCPERIKPYPLMAVIHMMDYWLGTSKSPQDSIKKAIELADRRRFKFTQFILLRGQEGGRL
jgi:hypothetical protein